eukprot:Tbor_TRINITY_DN3785_c0_g2::TRINITY_DN3785_c0_g2_i1::g.2433::m.2433/K02887/RP-L20, MRPL20, rplT; large subunit ribosomal protein L20
MLRATLVTHGWKANYLLWKARPALRGRAKNERILGQRETLLSLQKWTRFRVEHKRYRNKTLARSNIDAAAIEHGTSWVTLKNDLGRQNLALHPSIQQHLAQYEPLAFRSILELCSSRIAPPPSPVEKYIPEIPQEVYTPLSEKHDNSRCPTPAAERELRERLKLLLSVKQGNNGIYSKSTALIQNFGDDPEKWLNAWQEFSSIDASKRALPSH